MSNDYLWLLVIGMGIVTYVPRMLPMVFLKNLNLPPSLKRFLQFIPYAVLASLIFPGILTSVGTVESAIIGGLVSVILSLLRVNLILVVLGGIMGVFISEQMFLG